MKVLRLTLSFFAIITLAGLFQNCSPDLLGQFKSNNNGEAYEGRDVPFEPGNGNGRLPDDSQVYICLPPAGSTVPVGHVQIQVGQNAIDSARLYNADGTVLATFERKQFSGFNLRSAVRVWQDADLIKFSLNPGQSSLLISVQEIADLKITSETWACTP